MHTTQPKTERCRLCGKDYPAPAHLNHTEEQCLEEQLTAQGALKPRGK